MMHPLDYIQRALSLPDFDPMPAQRKMAPRPRPFQRPPGRPGEVRLGAVLLLLYRHKDNELHLVLVKRPSTLPNHGGQVSFPGGRKEAGESFATAALRETHEEVGIPPRRIQILGPLTPIYIPPSDFEVHPFVGWHAGRPAFAPSRREVAELLEVPLDHFRDENVAWQQADGFQYPYYQVGPHQIWGATAVIISEFLARLAAV